MKNNAKYLVFIILTSCNSKNQKLNNVPTNNDSSVRHSEEKISFSDTTKRRDTISVNKNRFDYIEPDVFIFAKDEIINYQESKTFPYFTSNELNCNLFFIPYTDGSVLTAILCKEFNIPNEYKNLLTSEGLNLKNKNTIPIQVIRIQTFKGINIDTRKKEFIDIFGNPDSTAIKNGIEILNWSFKMKETQSKQFDSRKLQPFILNGLQFDIELHFKKNDLITLIYNYEVP
jgi:hypothetical protein